MSLHYIAGLPNQAGALDSPNNDLTILVHGGALSHRMYRTMTPHLSQPWLAIDLPGHGKSVDLGPFTFAKSTSLLQSLIQSLSSPSSKYRTSKIALVGISLGGQAVLDFILTHPEVVYTAIVSGVSIHPPDEMVAWEMPHMPTNQTWIDIMMENVGIMGMDAAGGLQRESFAFSVDGRVQEGKVYPSVLICMGEHDIAMARRDFEELVEVVKGMNQSSEGRVLEGTWHNHSIDVPEQFAEVINRWVERRSIGQ